MSHRTSLKDAFPSIKLDIGKTEKHSGKEEEGGGGGGEKGDKDGKTKSQSHVRKASEDRRSDHHKAHPTNQQKRLSLPAVRARPFSPSVPSIVVIKEKESKHSSDGRSSSLERSTLSVPDFGVAARRFSDGPRPTHGSMAVPDRHGRKGSAETLTMDRLNSLSTSCLRLSREDLANLRRLSSAPMEDDKLDVAKIQSELRSEFEVEKSFRASYRQKFEPTGISSLVSLTPLMSLGPPAASSATSNEYLPLGGTELREMWRVHAAGEAQGEIRAIRGMCFTSSGQLAITEEKNSRVQIFNVNDGQSLRVLRETSSIRRMQPAGLCQIPDKPLLAVADLNRVVFLDHDFKGQWSTEVIVKNKTNLTGVAAIDGGTLVLTDVGIKPSVGLFEADGRLIREFQADFGRPQGVTVSQELGITFVSDSTIGCVYLFDHDGRLISRMGQTGDDLVRLVYPQGMCCLSSGTCLLVADRAQHRLVVFDVRNHAVDHLLASEDKLYSPICLASSGNNKYLAISEENQDFKVNDYELKMFRMKRGHRKQP